MAPKSTVLNINEFIPGLYWVLIINDNVYISLGTDHSRKITFSLWSKVPVEFEVSLRSVKTVSDLVQKIENSEQTGNISLLCFPTQSDQLKYVGTNFKNI